MNDRAIITGLEKHSDGALYVLDLKNKEDWQDGTLAIPPYLKKGDYESIYLILEQAVKKYGVWNVLAMFPDMLRSIGMGQREENEQRDRDYDFAADVIEAILPAVDLSYGEGSTTSYRQKVFKEAIDNVQKVRA
jgi:hypothetical protein